MSGDVRREGRNGLRAMPAGGSASFWQALDALVGGAEIVVDRPRGSHHPDFPEFVYELDYGYLKGTTSADGEGIDVWIGRDPRRRVTGALCTGAQSDFESIRFFSIFGVVTTLLGVGWFCKAVCDSGLESPGFLLSL